MSSVAVILGAGPGFGTSRVEHRCTDYDIDRPAGAMRADGSPEVDQLLSESLVMPRDPLELAELFERQADAQWRRYAPV